MITTPWKNYEQYLRSQKRSNRRKSKTVWVQESTIQRIVTYVGSDISRIICHGVRTGVELEFFHKYYPRAEIDGTDVRGKQSKGITEWDFNKQNPEWVGQFDLLYSNSLDHSFHLRKCAKVWMDQLAPDGLAFIEWSKYHRHVGASDCNGCSLDEYIGAFKKIGRVVDLIYEEGMMMRTLVVVRSRK